MPPRAIVQTSNRRAKIDIRYSPRSRKAGFSRSGLERTFGERYHHVREFGNAAYESGGLQLADPEAGLRIVAQKRIWLSEGQAEGFYAVHKERPFFKDLVGFMISGPVVVQVLEADNAVAKYRDVMGATNPANAAEGTIRKQFAESVEANTVHGSDAPETAAFEISWFFRGTEIHSPQQ